MRVRVGEIIQLYSRDDMQDSLMAKVVSVNDTAVQVTFLSQRHE